MPFSELDSARSYYEHENRHEWISNTACITSYRVEYSEGMNPYYYFRIDQAGFTSYAMVTWDFTYRFMWRKSTKKEFEKNLEKCHNDGNGRPQMPLVPRCDRKPVDSKPIRN
ncbi:hypothetical protein GCK32_017766 [Trichostrongylus colubriformis]|uniref:Uncharacterized protein n=1 Tax=Trichostrongylus colubriformis TaxID=6319 RepID=A0AAN8EYJ5_TRICO